MRRKQEVDVDKGKRVMNAPLHVRVLGDDISLQRLNQVFIFSSSVEPLHLRLRRLGFVLEESLKMRQRVQDEDKKQTKLADEK